MRPFHRDIIRYCREHGAESVRIEHSSKHPRLILSWRGTEHTIVIPGSPSCWRLIKNLKRDVMRIMG